MKKILFVTAVWCPTCLVMRPRYQNLVHNQPGWSLEELDFDENPVMIKQLNVGTTLPVAIVYEQQDEIRRIIGEVSAKELGIMFTSL
jgi:thiol-disulfide isomerase/thioredoxin